MDNDASISFGKAIIPIAFFFFLLIGGLFFYPQVTGNGMLPLEVLILMALFFSSIYLMVLGYGWSTIEKSISKKVGESIPVIMILFSIGVLIGSWIISGTIPMLIYHGIGLIDGNWIYIFAFVICIIFSLLTGTSWGSAGTIGIVLMGIGEVYEANLAITAAAVVGGSFFGDKMSPLSDTTNIAALATDTDVMDHIKSMMYTTGPAAIFAALLYTIMSPGFKGETKDNSLVLENIQHTLSDIDALFNFNIILLLPLVVVILGSVFKKPIVLTLLASAFLAMILAFTFQNFNTIEIFGSFKDGLKNEMIPEDYELKSNIVKILSRGGLYNLIEGIVVSLLIFAFIGTLEVISAIKTSLRGLMSLIKKRWMAVSAALTATWITNYTASNQYATSFIIGEMFKDKFDQLKIKRKVLSRSIEDAGTMLENLVPWTPSGIFMTMTLGVSTMEYWKYQYLSLFNIVIAFFFAFTGIACFYREKQSDKS